MYYVTVTDNLKQNYVFLGRHGHSRPLYRADHSGPLGTVMAGALVIVKRLGNNHVAALSIMLMMAIGMARNVSRRSTRRWWHHLAIQIFLGSRGGAVIGDGCARTNCRHWLARMCGVVMTDHDRRAGVSHLDDFLHDVADLGVQNSA